MFDKIIYVPKYGNEDFSLLEKKTIELIVLAGNTFNIPVYPLDMFTANQSDSILFISLGGDGTMLTAMRTSLKYNNSSVLGINYGHLGFLTSTDNSTVFADKNDVNPLETLIYKLLDNNNWHIHKRTTIGADIVVNGEIIKNTTAINEMLVTTPNRRNPLKYSIYINNKFVAEQSGDGIIVTTATGSTAYALSAGGSIMIPTSSALQIVPLAAHTLTAKPIVLSSDDEIKIKTAENQRAGAFSVISDGRHIASIPNDNIDFELIINKKLSVNVWYPDDWNFFNVLNKKMKW